jgi:hypothetical protein
MPVPAQANGFLAVVGDVSTREAGDLSTCAAGDFFAFESDN